MIAAASSNNGNSTTATAASKEVPVPPNYTACITTEQASAPKATKKTPAPTQTELKSECEQKYKSLETQALSYLIRAEWILNQATSMGINVSDKTVKQQFVEEKNQQFKTTAAFQAYLASSNETVSDILLGIKINLLATQIKQKIDTENEQVSQTEISNYYNQNPQKFSTPEQRNIKVIITKTQATAIKAKEEIATGTNFGNVAKSISIDQTSKNKGGVVTGVEKGQDSPALDNAIFSAKTNTLEGPISTPFGYYIFQVTSVTPATSQTLAQAQATIKQQLASSQPTAAFTKFAKAFQKEWTAKTNCLPNYVVVGCKQYKAPATGTTSGTTAPVTGTPTTTTGATSAPVSPKTTTVTAPISKPKK
jgi:parvulin-like peptidyl-prolyl isomerase